MASAPRSVRVAVFGSFCFDLTSRDLHKHGIHLRLEEKPALVLQRLIESAGTVVARRELQEFLWPNGIHVDFNHGLNKSINRLRAVLGDDLDQPRYIQTLSKRGYRFVAPVEISTAEPAKAELVKSQALYPLPQFAADIPTSGVLDQRDGFAPGKAALAPWFRYRKAALAGAMLGIALLLSLGTLRLRDRVNAASNFREAAPVYDFVADSDLGISFPSTNTLRQMASVLPHDREATRWYVQGLEKLRRFETVAAQRDFVAASNIEPGHALTHSALSTTWSKLGHNRDAQRESQKAFDLSLTLPLESRLVIEGQLKETLYDWIGAIETYKTLFQHYPDNLEYGLHTATVEIVAGRGAAALATLELLRKSSAFAAKDPRIDLVDADAAASFSDFKRQRTAAANALQKSQALGANLLSARAELLEGEALRALGDFANAEALWMEARKEFESVGDRSAVARLMIDEGRLRWQEGDPTRSKESYEEAISIGKSIGDDANLGRALAGLGQVQMFQVGPAEGRRLCQAALDIFQRIGNKQEEAYTLSLMGDLVASQHQEAKKLYEQSLALSRKVGDRSRTAGRLMDLGIIATVQGDLRTADRELQESLQTYREIGERSREALQQSNLAIVRKWQGRLEEAEHLAKQAIATLTLVGEINTRGQVRQILARIQLEAGRAGDAERTAWLAMEDHLAAKDVGSQGLAQAVLGEILVAQGQYAEARTALRAYETIVWRNPPRGEHEPILLVTRARIDAAEGNYEAALAKANQACAEALGLDQRSISMKTRLALGEIELQSGMSAQGRKRLEELKRDAEEKGFGLISTAVHKDLAH